MYLGTGAYLDDLDAKLRPIAWLLGLSILGIAIIAGSIAWLIGRSISRPLGQLGARMQALADGSLEADIPGVGRGDEIGAMAATVQIFKDNAVRIRGLEKAEAETQARAAQQGIKVLGWYLTQGQYDVVTIVDAPDEMAVAAGTLAIAGAGNFHTETLRAYTLEETEQIIQRMG